MKRQSIPIISSSKSMLLNMATSRKIWCRIDYSSDTINEPILIEYDEMDTVDDFKTKIFNKLNESRWKDGNDNASIVLGFYQTKNGNINSTNIITSVNDRSSSNTILPTESNIITKSTVGSRTNSRGLQRIDSYGNQSESPIFANKSNNNNITREEMNITPISDKPPLLNRTGSNTNEISSNTFIFDNSEDTTPQRLSSSSPKLILPGRVGGQIPPKYGFHPLSNSYNSNKNSPMFLPPLTIPYHSPSSSMSGNSSVNSNGNGNTITSNNPTVNSKAVIQSPSYIIHPSLRKQLNYTIEEINDNLCRIVFQPDQLISEIYMDLFGSLGQQTSNQPLLIFSNKNLSISRHNSNKNVKVSINHDPKSHFITPMGGKLYNKESSTVQLEHKEEQLFQNNTPDNSAVLYPDPTKNALEQGQYNNGSILEGVNEEGLNSLDINNRNDDESESDYPKQGVLLLPKDYYNKENEWTVGDGFNEEIFNESNMKEKDVKPLFRTTTVSSVSSSNSDNSKSDEQDQVLMHTKRVLSEQEVGPNTIDNEMRKPLSPVQMNELPLNNPNMLLDIPINNPSNISNVVSNGNNIITKNINISNVPTPLSTTFPIPLKLIKNENIGIRNAENNNVNTSEKVFPKINVLIVEDNVINQAIMGSFLRKHKISYKIAKNGKEAVDKWKEGGLHLIFMDLQLPVLSGIEAAKQIRDCEKKKTGVNNAPVIIVALTASNSIEDKRKALISGCNDYLTKPVNLHWLSKKITEWGCMQALIDFDSWKQGQSRMTDNVMIKSPHKTKMKDN